MLADKESLLENKHHIDYLTNMPKKKSNFIENFIIVLIDHLNEPKVLKELLTPKYDLPVDLSYDQQIKPMNYLDYIDTNIAKLMEESEDD